MIRRIDEVCMLRVHTTRTGPTVAPSAASVRIAPGQLLPGRTLTDRRGGRNSGAEARARQKGEAPPPGGNHIHSPHSDGPDRK